MRIGIDLLWLRPGREGGIGTHVRGLLNGLAQFDADNDYVLFTTSEVAERLSELPGNFRCRIICRSVRHGINGQLLQQVYIPRYVRGDRIDVLHSPANTTSLAAGCPRVVTIHDLTLSSLSRYASSVRERVSALKARLLSSLVNSSARSADAVITDSEFSRTTIIDRLSIPAERIRVIYSALNIAQTSAPGPWRPIAERLGIVMDYIIAFSNQFLHKNIEALIKAFARLQASRPLQLVVVGHLPNDGGRLQRTIGQLRLGGNVVLTGYLDDGDLGAVLSRAKMLAFPSLSEGFGLPVLEAMAADVPVACSNATALPEVAGNAAIYFDPRSVEDMAATLQRLADDEALRRKLILAGHQNVKRFSWENAARETVNVYRSVSTARA